uniref:Disintegrin domain-containing protein n=1 Tax=Xenopus tropicalis TaxID=8364 RepID=A0A803JI66_XENTR
MGSYCYRLKVDSNCLCGLDQCCDAATCKLKPGAQCAEGECCSNCKIKAAGEVCRERNDDDCDLEDVCDGTSPWCPSDRFQANGAPCGKGEGYCYNGTCPTMQRQCTSLWGDSKFLLYNLRT